MCNLSGRRDLSWLARIPQLVGRCQPQKRRQEGKETYSDSDGEAVVVAVVVVVALPEAVAVAT